MTLFLAATPSLARYSLIRFSDIVVQTSAEHP
jgi:hypothetical protein